jgi:hypothetical protein
MKYQVIVGNVGIVYNGENAKEATRCFVEYCDQSWSKHGRAAGESVTLMKDGEIEREQIALNDDDENNAGEAKKPNLFS